MNDATHTLAEQFLTALRANEPYRPPSEQRLLELSEALAVQRAFNDLRSAHDPLAGFKAAVNADGPQRALGLAAPITGALFVSGARAPGAVVSRSAFRNLLIETELGFRTTRRIDAPIEDIADLQAAIATVAPMFELADPGFGRSPIRGTDLVAANAACGGFVEGPPRPVREVNLDAEVVRLQRDGEILHEARGSDLMCDHWRALSWLVNTLVAQGLVIDAGQLLMTGALGGAHPAAPGRYRAEFSSLGVLELKVVP
jgi:2-keto-4-pentenoate hydratase